MYEEIYQYENLELAYNRARKRKTTKSYVIEFEEKLKENLTKLQEELILQTYKPHPLQIFILRDPKSRNSKTITPKTQEFAHYKCFYLLLLISD